MATVPVIHTVTLFVDADTKVMASDNPPAIDIIGGSGGGKVNILTIDDSGLDALLGFAQRLLTAVQYEVAVRDIAARTLASIASDS